MEVRNSVAVIGIGFDSTKPFALEIAVIDSLFKLGRIAIAFAFNSVVLARQLPV